MSLVCRGVYKCFSTKMFSIIITTPPTQSHGTICDNYVCFRKFVANTVYINLLMAPVTLELIFSNNVGTINIVLIYTKLSHCKILHL